MFIYFKRSAFLRTICKDSLYPTNVLTGSNNCKATLGFHYNLEPFVFGFKI